MITAADAKNRLLGQLESFLSYLYPSGKIEGSEFRVGDTAGTPGHSLAVQLKGDARGVWKDYGGSPDDVGDIFDLYCKAKNQTFKEAFPELLRYLGMVEMGRPAPKPKPTPPDLDLVKGLSGTPTFEYLTKVRGIRVDILRKYGIRSHKRQSPHNTDFIAFQFIDSEGERVMLKSTGIKRTKDDKKDIWTTAPYYTLWGWWLVKPSDREIVITEGEIDAMSLCQLEAGRPVLSLPAGASNLSFIENDWTALQRFEKIWLCFDSDDAGEKGATECAKRLGLTRCFRIGPPGPFKDVNEALTKGEPEDTDINAWFAGAVTYDPPTLRGARSFLEESQRLLGAWDSEAKDNKFVLPSVPFAVRRGECTLLTGVTGHGKSEMLYQILGHEMTKGERVCIASFEIDPKEMLINIAQQIIGRKPVAVDLAAAFSWLDGRLWFFTPPEDHKREDWKRLFDDFRYAAARFGCSRFAIDSLLFVTGKEEYDDQDTFCKMVRDFDRFHDTHTFLIAHASTKKSETDVPRMSDVSGSGGILAPFPNIVIVWRNLQKEDDLEKALNNGDSGEAERVRKTHDGLFYVAKQRRTGRRSKTKLWFNHDSRTFRTIMDLPPVPTAEELPF